MIRSLQLYSARNAPPWDAVIATVAGLGYQAVEGFGPVYEDAAGFRALLDRHGLAMPTAHVALDALENDPGRALDAARMLGVRDVYAPWIAPEDRAGDRAGWERLAARLAAVAPRVRDAGFGFGWHNHDFEFAALPDGSVPMQILLEQAPIDWEADIAWIVRGGADPLGWIAQHGARITAVHVKDIAPAGDKTDEDGWADPGTGTMDWPAILAALASRSRARVAVAEHDNPSDFNRFAAAAARLLQTIRGTP